MIMAGGDGLIPLKSFFFLKIFSIIQVQIFVILHTRIWMRAKLNFHGIWIALKQGKSEGFDSCDRPDNLTQNGFNHRFFSPCDLEIWWMTSKNYRAPLLHYIKLCALFQSHQWIKSRATVWKRSIWVKIGDFLSRVTLKFDGGPSKTIGHLFYVASSFVHHFIAISGFKLKLLSGNA